VSWIDAAIAAGLVVASKDQYPTLSLTPEGREAIIRPIERRSKFSICSIAAV
jgi:hypothetical protein